MHDFILAKEIIDELLVIAKEKNIKHMKSVSLEIGSGSAPRGHKHAHAQDEHLDELNMENVQFGLESVSRNTSLKDVKFKITKIKGNNWKITNIEI